MNFFFEKLDSFVNIKEFSESIRATGLVFILK